MIGFDRPLRPAWIYESLLLAQPGQRLGELNQPFDMIARELTGKEGKRKARTVLFRCFLRDPHNRARVRKRLWLKELSEQHELDFMIPIYLFYLIASTEALVTLSEHIFRLYDFGNEINLAFLKRKMAEGCGDRDVVTRAARAFVKTLLYFGVMEERDKRMVLKKPLQLSNEQARTILLLWAREIMHTPQISLNNLPEPVFGWFELPDKRALAQRYNGEDWDYQHRMDGDYLMVY